MSFKILEQDCAWMVDGSINLKSQEYLDGIGIAEATFVMNSKNPPNDFMDYGLITLVSENIVSVLKKYDDMKVTFSPVTFIWNEEIYEKHNFYIMRVVEELDCINYEESMYECFESAPTEIRSLSKLVTYDVDTSKHKLFIIDNTCFLCVDSSICDELMNQGCTGFEIIEVSDATI
jgi:hypothetical protein